MDAFANSWIDCMKLAVCSIVPDILPFFNAESGNTRLKLVDSDFVFIAQGEYAMVTYEEHVSVMYVASCVLIFVQ